MTTLMTAQPRSPGGRVRAALLSLLALLALQVPAVAVAGPDSKRSEVLLEQAIKLCRVGKLEASLSLLEQARTQQAAEEQAARKRDKKLVGRILLYKGLNLAMMGKRARSAFRLALAEDPGLRVSPTSFKPELVKLFNEERDRVTARLVVSGAASDAIVLVDGERRGKAPLTLRLTAGRHRVRVQGGDGEVILSRELVFVAGKSVRVAVRLDAERPQPRRLKLWTLVMAGTSVALTAAGVALWASSAASYTDLEESYEDLLRRREAAAIEDLKATVKAKDTAAVVMFSLAGASAVAAVVLFLLDRRVAEERPRQSMGARIIPLVSQGAGFMLQARF